jgi:hypothetical protein
MNRFGSLLACALLVATGTLGAQTSRTVNVGLGAGLTLLTGEDRDFFKDGLNLQASVAVPLRSAGIDLRFDLGYHRIGGKDRFTAPPPSDTLQLGDFNVIALTASAQYYPSPAAPARMYLIAGFGLYRLEAKAVHYGQAVEGSSTDFGAAGGVGVSFRLGGMRGFVEGRIHNIFGDGGSAQLYPVTVGVLF